MVSVFNCVSYTEEPSEAVMNFGLTLTLQNEESETDISPTQNKTYAAFWSIKTPVASLLYDKCLPTS